MSTSPDHDLALLTPEEMSRADAMTIASGTPGYQLMLAAGQAVFDTAKSEWPETRTAAILCGPGNNGGDGFVVARLLADAGWQVEVALLSSASELAGDAARAYRDWARPVIPVEEIDLEKADLIIDALFGAGLSRPLSADAAKLVGRINNCTRAAVLSVDLPSGLDGRTGQPLGMPVQADATVTFFRPKPGHYLEPGRSLCGQLHVADIGIPSDTTRSLGIRLARNAPDLWRNLYPRPSASVHKYKRGHALVFSGGEFSTGAARLTAQAALRVGAGLVSIGGDQASLRVHAAHVTAIMLKVCNRMEDVDAHLSDERINALAIGPGLGLTEQARDLVDLASLSDKALVADADALTLMARDEKLILKRFAEQPAPRVLTPHEGEFRRLFPAINDTSKVERARQAAAFSGCIIVYKGPDTVIATPDGRAVINANAPPWLATAGSGDMLAGIVTGLLAQGMPGFEAAAAGVWLHGEAAIRLGRGMTADDLDEGLRQVLRTAADF